MFWFSSLISFFIPLGWYSTISGSSEGEIMEVLPYLGFARLSPHIHSWLVMERFGINSMKKNGIEFFIKIGRLYSSPSHIDLVTRYRIKVYLSSSVIGFHSIVSTQLLPWASNADLIIIDKLYLVPLHIFSVTWFKCQNQTYGIKEIKNLKKGQTWHSLEPIMLNWNRLWHCEFYHSSEIDDVVAVRTFKTKQTNVVITPIRVVWSGEWEHCSKTMLKRLFYV